MSATGLMSAPWIFFILVSKLRDQPPFGDISFSWQRGEKSNGSYSFCSLMLCDTSAHILLAKAVHMAKPDANEVGIYSCHGGGGPEEEEVL